MGEEESKDTVIDIPKKYYMDNTLDGVPWNEGQEDKRSFPKAFVEVLKTCSLTGVSKLIIKQRFLGLYRYYRKKHKYITIVHNASRITISIGSIIVPALLTLDNEISDRSLPSQIIYYTTFSISLIVTITNTIYELMQINKKYYNYSNAKQTLTTEGWSFLSLSGKYKNYNDHSECWRKFINKVEKVNTNTLNSNLVLSSNKPDEIIINPKVAYTNLGIDTFSNTNSENDKENIIYSYN